MCRNPSADNPATAVQLAAAAAAASTKSSSLGATGSLAPTEEVIKPATAPSARPSSDVGEGVARTVQPHGLTDHEGNGLCFHFSAAAGVGPEGVLCSCTMFEADMAELMEEGLDTLPIWQRWRHPNDVALEVGFAV